MINPKLPPFLEESVSLLVRHFGPDKVQAALESAVQKGHGDKRKPSRGGTSGNSKPSKPPILTALHDLKEKDQEKHIILTKFFENLKSRSVLPDSQDIRQFAQVVGLKDVEGKTRKDMSSSLMRFLIEQPTDQLKGFLKDAEGISERDRQQGFSILTDKLLGDK